MQRGTQLASSEEGTQLFQNLHYFQGGNSSSVAGNWQWQLRTFVLLKCMYSLSTMYIQEWLVTDRTS